jgi:uncharacterized protein (DUF1800 family)
MNEREQIAWLYRRVGFGLRAGQLDEPIAGGVAAALDTLLDPSAARVPPAPDPWAGIDYSGFDPNNGRDKQKYVVESIAAWIGAMVDTPRPFEEWMRWFWHSHFVSTLRVTKYPQLMVTQMHTFADPGVGDFRSLLKAATVDPAMLVYLDGVTNAKNAVNENYGREVLELFALGIGNYTEDDVRAGAEALSGYGSPSTQPWTSRS